MKLLVKTTSRDCLESERKRISCSFNFFVFSKLLKVRLICTSRIRLDECEIDADLPGKHSRALGCFTDPAVKVLHLSSQTRTMSEAVNTYRWTHDQNYKPLPFKNIWAQTVFSHYISNNNNSTESESWRSLIFTTLLLKMICCVLFLRWYPFQFLFIRSSTTSGTVRQRGKIVVNVHTTGKSMKAVNAAS